jgi:prophage maintenance system killer protein
MPTGDSPDENHLRTAASALFLFLCRHGLDFDPPDDSLATMTESAAAGTLNEENLADQVARWTKPFGP